MIIGKKECECQLWSNLSEQIESSLVHLLGEDDEVISNLMAIAAIGAIMDFVLLEEKERWGSEDIEPYIKAFWKNVGEHHPKLLSLRKPIIEGMRKELLGILKARK